VGLIGLLLGTLLAASIIRTEGSPEALIRAPSGDPEMLAHIESLLGPVPTFPEYGHDGKFFLLLALDPFLTDRESLSRYFDLPAYRAERILYPMLAGGFGLLGPGEVVWGLIVVNVAAMGLGVWATARICQLLGLPPVLGLFFCLNPGLIYELGIDSASILGMALAFVGLLFVLQGAPWMAAGFFLLGGLARETMILLAVGAVACLVLARRRRPAAIVATSVLLLGGWLAFIRWLMPRSRLTDVPESFTLPFQGLLGVVPDWLSHPPSQQANLIWLLICVVVCAIGAWLRPSPFSWGVAAFLPLLIVLSEPVARYDFNLTRAVAPFLTAGPILAWAMATRSGHYQAGIAKPGTSPSDVSGREPSLSP
jgi:hypothetical protein